MASSRALGELALPGEGEALLAGDRDLRERAVRVVESEREGVLGGRELPGVDEQGPGDDADSRSFRASVG